jgi:rubrerythrin
VCVRNFYFRIDKDNIFHCDVCGVCLGVQLRGNHKCRAGSAHDECCICLEVMYQFEVLIRNECVDFLDRIFDFIFIQN